MNFSKMSEEGEEEPWTLSSSEGLFLLVVSFSSSSPEASPFSLLEDPKNPTTADHKVHVLFFPSFSSSFYPPMRV
jgi:hypothetical protein